MPEFDAALPRAVETYNEYRSHVATADLLAVDADGFRVRFEGPFCTTCCRDDYFEDLVYELDALGVDIDPVSVTGIEQTGLETFVVDFAVATAVESGES